MLCSFIKATCVLFLRGSGFYVSNCTALNQKVLFVNFVAAFIVWDQLIPRNIMSC